MSAPQQPDAKSVDKCAKALTMFVCDLEFDNYTSQQICEEFQAILRRHLSAPAAHKEGE